MCGYLGWADDEGVGQLIQLGDFHSLGRLDHELVLVGGDFRACSADKSPACTAAAWCADF